MALESGPNIVELADRLTQSADAIHARLLKAIKDGQVDRNAAQRLFQDEGVLRQRANALYIDAAGCVVADLRQPQKNLLELVDEANERIERSRTIARFLDLVADLLVLAAAVHAAKPGPIVAALREMKQDVEELGG